MGSPLHSKQSKQLLPEVKRSFFFHIVCDNFRLFNCLCFHNKLNGIDIRIFTGHKGNRFGFLPAYGSEDLIDLLLYLCIHPIGFCVEFIGPVGKL